MKKENNERVEEIKIQVDETGDIFADPDHVTKAKMLDAIMAFDTILNFLGLNLGFITDEEAEEKGENPPRLYTLCSKEYATADGKIKMASMEEMLTHFIERKRTDPEFETNSILCLLHVLKPVLMKIPDARRILKQLIENIEADGENSGSLCN